ncbi:MerR family transcriptional regulator [Saccharothrix syringae]|uniref:MerR family transcriptional regulator n=1 Tax=Saccharothrix syringae TaxID=103733 RepID=A0A5Q0HA71_SACSY|nr:MerR family transcriptional regulator [Saccharothrix syringae]QFZ23148.1 MerR family transcriptional regulator [Saccharothrix syringae]
MLIGELSRRTGVSPRLLRYYEEQGLLSSCRGPNGYRTYADDAVGEVRRIRGLLAAGLGTEVIRELLPCASGEQPELELCPAVRGALSRELAGLDDRIDALRRMRGALAAYLEP